LRGILPDETNANLAQGVFAVAGVGWWAHGIQAGSAGDTRLAAIYLVWGGLFLGGAWWCRARPVDPRGARPHQAAALFFSGAVLVLVLSSKSSAPSQWDLVSIPTILLIWAGRRVALGWGLVALVVVAIEGAIGHARGEAAMALGISVFQRLTSMGGLFFLGELLLKALQVHHELLRARDAQIDAQTAEMEARLAELQQARDEALEGIRLKSNFLATMSHELRTPLNAVLGMANLLQETELTEEQQEYTTTIVGGSQALLTLIGDILDLSKLEAGKLEVERASVDLHHIAERALALVCAQAHSKGIELYFAPAGDAPTSAVTDPARLQQILVNLLSNAVKFTDHGDVVLELLPGDSPQEVWFSVKDTGVGIEPAMIDKLFRPFSQVGAGNQRGGTGLGLMISQALVGLLGGQIGVQSEPGKGSTFSFSFRSHGEPQMFSLSGIVTSIPGHVVLFDDCARSRELLEEQLHGVAKTVRVFSSAPEFLSAVEHLAQIDAIVLDPRVSGWPPTALLQRLLDLPGELPPVVLLYPKGAPERKQVEGFFQANFVRTGSAFWAKPLMPRQILQAVLVACLGEVTAERSVATRLPRSDGKSGSHKLRLLVAEDNAVNQRVINKTLAKLGHEVEIVENGKLAVEAVLKGKVDVLFLDVQMPVMDGLEAARQIVKLVPRKRRPRIIGLTANALAGDREKCLAAGMDDYLPKPVQIQDLARVLGASPHDSQNIGDTVAEVIDPHVASQLRVRYAPSELANLLDLISSQISADCAAIVQAFTLQDIAAVEVTAARLKERCATVGLVRLYAVLTKIEQDAGKKNLDELTRYVGRLEREGEQGKKAILRLSSSVVG
jgi:signal transduction histidine kinase/DNA-binding response OmpR family regulator